MSLNGSPLIAPHNRQQNSNLLLTDLDPAEVELVVRKNLELVRSLGADHTVDYTREDFTRVGKRYDVILDMGANHSLSDLRRALTNDGRWLLVGAVASGGWLGPLGRLVSAMAQSPFVSQKIQLVSARVTAADLVVMGHFLESGKIKPVIEKTYSLDDVSHALRHVEQGHARGKVVITIP